jgi:hypothetical protein
MLKVELRQSQITAANRIRRQLPTWSAADDAFGILAKQVPGFKLPETMLKVAAINQLYGTNLYAVNRMAAHITAALRRGVSEPGPGLVERIACVPPLDGQRSWRHFSFASKFCHFFVDRESCPIFDSYADDTLRRHLGRKRERDSQHPYIAFVKNATALRNLSGVTATAVEMDRYLWIRGAF